MVGPEHIEILDGRFGSVTLEVLFGYRAGFGLPSETQCEEIRRVMAEMNNGDSTERKREDVSAS